MMMQRYLWTSDRNDRQTRGGLSPEAELIDVLVAEDLHHAARLARCDDADGY